MAGIPLRTLEALIHLGEVEEICPYLGDRVSTLRYGDGAGAGEMYRYLLDRGYRRSGRLVYRPVCRECRACQVIRVPVAEFKRSKSQRRVWNRASRIFTACVSPPEFSEEKLEVYRRYLEYQHRDSPMSADEEHYRGFLVNSPLRGGTVEVQYRMDGRLAGLGLLDQVMDALSTVYFYFDPDFARYSLGTFSALFEIELARRLGLAHYYLGYYIAPCSRMNYKARFRPCEIKDPDEEEWRRIDCSGGAAS